MQTAERDAQLRASLLTHARLAGGRQADGWATCNQIAIAARDREHAGAADDAHATRLIDELIEYGLLAEKPRQVTNEGPGQADLRHRMVKLTTKGFRLWMGEIDPVPGVADRRHG
jgi:hypothetical protein